MSQAQPKSAAAAVELVNNQRQATYGHPYDDFTRSTGCLTALGYRFVDAEGRTRGLNATDIPIIMNCVKLAREVHVHHEDNIVDIHGYMNCLEMVRDRLNSDKKVEG